MDTPTAAGDAGPRIAVLGAGAWGWNHVRTWHSLGRLHAVADPSPDARARVAEAFDDVLLLERPEDALARDDIDAVVVATPAVTHVELAVAALRAGKHVLVEKPMGISLAEAQHLHEVAQSVAPVLLVGHVLEYHPAFLALRSLVADGTLGDLRYLYSNRLNFGRIRTEENALWSFAPHDIALFVRLVGHSPVDVSCHGGSWLSPEVADVTLMSLDFEGDVRGHVFVSWLHPFKEQRLVVVGEREMVVFDDTAPWAEKLVRYPHAVDWVQDTIPVARRAEGINVPLEEREPLRAECEHFLAAIAGTDAVLTDSASGVQVLEVLEAGGRSLAQGGAPVRVRSDVP